ncbi:MAG: polyketide beta-ketoacyl:ACP synthase [Alteromonadaceae bacterium]|nr:MAG: polyketide beta-ketoacyl:ACP synthase [Alteromonadaceae bacterium]
MSGASMAGIAVTGIGVTASIGQGKDEFLSALLQGQSAFSVLRREGRQIEGERFLGAEIPPARYPDSLPKSALQSASLTAQVALTTLHEAWQDAQLDQHDPERVGLVVAGSNLQQRALYLTQQRHHQAPYFLTPSYAMSFMDTDICGFCTENFGIRGLSASVGGASASGQMAVIQAIQNILSGLVDTCIVVAPFMDLSLWELQGFSSLGAMGSNRFTEQPHLACRPFDNDRDGFIFGESCGAIVLEKYPREPSRKTPYSMISGWGVAIDGNRNPNPNLDGEIRAIRSAITMAKLSSADIDYINPHGSGSSIGDDTELQALNNCDLNHAYINTTKSIVGHGLSSAGLVELIATILQMQSGKLHPCNNLDQPIREDFNWVRGSVSARVNKALTLSLGFGGVNTALCVNAYPG